MDVNIRNRLVIAVLVILSVISIAQGCMNALANPNGAIDFHYPLWRHVALRMNPYIDTLNPASPYSPHYINIPALNLPSTYIFLLPLGYLDVSTASLVWCIGNVIFSLGIAMLLKVFVFDKVYSGDSSALIYMLFMAVFFIGTPSRNTIGNAQTGLFSFFFLLLSFWLSEKNYRFMAGLALSVSYYKYALTVPISLYFLYKRKYKEFIIAAIVHIVFTFALGLRINASPIEMIRMFLQISSMLTSAGLYDICALFGINSVGLSVVMLVMMTAFVFYCGFKRSDRDWEILSLLAVFTLVFMYHRIYDYFVLIIPLIVCMSSNKYSLLEKIIICLCVAYIFFIQRVTGNIVLHYIFAVIFYAMFFSILVRLIRKE